MNALQCLTFALVVTLTGCVSVPQSRAVSQAAATVPANWRATAGQDGSANDLVTWWNGFADAQLRDLINRALANNYDLKAAVERSRKAQALITVSRARLYPDIGLTASAARLRTDVPPPAGTIANSAIGVSGQWEADVFGGNQLAALAQTAEANATDETRRDFEVALTANVATTYSQLRGLQRQLEILNGNIAVRADTLHLIQVRYEAGLATDLDVARAETQLRQVEASIPDVQRQVENDLGVLAILTGQPPQTVDDTLRAPAPIPSGAPALPAQAPAALLERRPDLRAAAQRIDAASARLGSAKADLLPKFTLSFAGAVDRLEFRNVPPVSANLFNIGLGVFWPLFNSGRIHANISAQDAELRVAEYTFDQALLNALQDVEATYTDVRAHRERSAVLSLALESAQRSSQLAQDLYQAGTSDFLSVLDAHTQVLDSEQALAQAQTDAAVGAVALYRALGGGWRTNVALAATSTVNPLRTPWAPDDGS